MGAASRRIEGQQVVENLLAQWVDKGRAQAVAVEVLGDRAAIEALAVWVMEGGSGAWAAAQMQMRGLRGTGSLVDSLVGEVKARVRALEAQRGDPRAQARQRAADEREQALQGLARRAGLEWEPQMPEGWACTEKGVWTVDEDGIRREVACRYPMLLVGIQQAEGEELVEVAWSCDRGSTWTRAGIRRPVVRSAQALVAGAPDGMPVDSGTAGTLIRWLGDLEAANSMRRPARRVSLKLGWCGGGFVLGHRFIGPAADAVGLGDGVALGQLAETLQPKGTWEGWCAVARAAMQGRPLVALGVLGAVASVLLEVLQEPGFVLSFDGGSGGGKSTTLRLAASVWAGRAEGYWRKWDTTQQGVEDLAGLLQHLPLVLDETQLARSPEVVRGLLYAVPEGVGRLKGTTSGTPRPGKAWRLAMLSSGEQGILSFAGGAAGASARTLSIAGHPFGRAPVGSMEEAEHARAARACEQGLKQHGGWLGAKVLELLVGMDWARLQADHHAQDQLLAGAVKGTAAKRVMRHVATLSIAQTLIEATGFGAIGPEPIQVALEAAIKSGASVDKARAAMEEVGAWFWANPKEFQRTPEDKVPQGGWWGLVQGATLYVRKAMLDSTLVEWGFEVDSILAAWAERGWLELGREKGRRTVLKRTPDGARVYYYGLKRTVLEGSDAED